MRFKTSIRRAGAAATGLAGAGGVIGTEIVTKSPPDGYTLMLGGSSMTGTRFINAIVNYDGFTVDPLLVDAWVSPPPLSSPPGPAAAHQSRGHGTEVHGEPYRKKSIWKELFD